MNDELLRVIEHFKTKTLIRMSDKHKLTIVSQSTLRIDPEEYLRYSKQAWLQDHYIWLRENNGLDESGRLYLTYFSYLRDEWNAEIVDPNSLYGLWGISPRDIVKWKKRP